MLPASSTVKFERLIVIVRASLEFNDSNGDHIMSTHGVAKNRTLPPQTSDGNMVRMSNTKCAYGYVRVSTDMQAQYGLSLEAQESQIKGYAQAYGYEVIGFYIDHDSAKNITGRPEYQKMMVEIDKGKA